MKMKTIKYLLVDCHLEVDNLIVICPHRRHEY